MCVLSIKVPIRKKFGNLFNDPHISVNLCCLDFNHEVSIRTSLLFCILLKEICCCLYLRICAVLTQTMRCTIEFAVLNELLNEPPCVCIIRCILDGKVNWFFQEMFFA